MFTTFRRHLLPVLLIPLLAALLLSGLSARAADDSRVWVVFKAGQKGPVKTQIQSARGQIHYEFDDLRAIAATLPVAALAGLRNNPNVELVEDDPPRYPLGQTVPYGIDKVQARDIWDANRDSTVDAGAPTGSGIKVGVIDSGVYSAHDDLSGVSISGYDGTGSAGGVFSDLCAHGTHVVGTIAAANNSLGVVGVTPGTVSIYMVKVFGDNCSWAYSSTLVDAAQRAQKAGAKIISMSLGGSLKSTTENQAFENLYNAGILSIAAAGNGGNTQFSYPASYNSVVSVAALDQNEVVAGFSQKNSQVELAAPGVGVLSTVPYVTPKVTVNGNDYPAGQIEFAATGTATGVLVDGGKALTVDSSWSGKVVLVERGDISFYDKVRNVQLGGGLAAVIYNNVAGGFSGTLGTGNSSSIPAVSITREDGLFLKANGIGQSATVASPAPGTVGSGYDYYDGTSMATPHVSAVAALVWSCNPGLSNAQIRDALQKSAKDLGAAGKDNSYGYGLVQAAAALSYLGCGTASSAPVVAITSPANGANVTSGSSITFSGTATDATGGNVSENLVWTANGLSLGTGASFIATLSDGNYTIVASATDGNGTGSASIAITVGSTPTPSTLGVAVVTDKAAYVNRETVTITATVTDGASAVSGAAVHLALTTANGGRLVGDATSGADGKVKFTYKVNSRRDGVGTYTAAITATKSGYSSGTGSTSFTVTK